MNNLYFQSVSCDASESQSRNYPSFLNNAHTKKDAQYNMNTSMSVTDFSALKVDLFDSIDLYSNGLAYLLSLQNCARQLKQSDTLSSLVGH
jgi:hypothetical protein